MMFAATKTETYTARMLRHFAALLALLFVFVAGAALLHTDVTVTGSVVSVTQTVATNAHPAPAEHSIAVAHSVADCSLCDYLQTPFALTGVAVIFTVTFAALVALTLAVRLAALCSAPTPRRGLRAPPTLSPA